MGAIYKAKDTSLGVFTAVKENLFTTEEGSRQFRKEATILAGVRHPNLPRVTDHFVIAGQGQYLVMDYIDAKIYLQVPRLIQIPICLTCSRQTQSRSNHLV
ncbi:MAG: hypothetical protein ABFD29_12300 [Anaerolineaceae bacterium]